MIFLYNNVLFFMLIPTLLLMFLIITKKDNFAKYFSKDTLEKLSVSNQFFSNKARNITLFLSLIFMIIALARPVANEKNHDVKQKLNTMVIAIDISKSMLATDIYPNRLEFAKTKLLNIVENAKDSAIAVILFAKSSFILSPLTQDFTSLKILIENLNTGANFDNGTNIYSTLEVTNKLLKDYSNKNLLLLSDGGDKDDFSDELEYAKEKNIAVYTIAMASKNGAAIKLKDGNYLTNKQGEIITSKMNENIKQLALNTKGGYINYSLDNNDIIEIIKDIKEKSKKQEFKTKKFKTYTELFYYPLALAIFLLLIAFSSLPSFKRKTNSSLLLLFLLFSIFVKPSDINASVFDFLTIKNANESYKNEEYKKAQNEYSKIQDSNEKKYNMANALYKDGKYKEAIKNYNEIKNANKDLEFKKLHNSGNAYAKNGDLEKAKESYENALKFQDDKETKENLNTVKKALEKKKQKQENKSNKNNKDKKQNKKKQDKNKQNKESKENSENKKNDKKEKNKKDSDSKKEEEKQKKKSESKEKNQKDDNLSKQKNKQLNEKTMSDKEEQRWLKQLENQQTNSLLKKVESQKEYEVENPW